MRENQNKQRHRGEKPRQGIQGSAGAPRRLVHRRAGHGLRFARSQRLGQDDHDQHPDHVDHADAGTASVAGFDVAEQPAEVREQISLTGQFAAVDDVLTARENLVLIGELRRVADPGQTAAELLDKFDLGEAADRRLATFSGGMRRRLDIAMSLVGDSPIIFFDEPSTGLDPKSRADMWLTHPATGRERDHGLPDHPVPGGGRPSR